MSTELDTTESRLRSLIDRYRPELEDGTIYSIPALVWPGATGHDYFVAIKRAQRFVSLYLIIIDRYPEELEAASAELRACRTGRATLSFKHLGTALESDLRSLLDRLLIRYREEHS